MRRGDTNHTARNKKRDFVSLQCLATELQKISASTSSNNSINFIDNPYEEFTIFLIDNRVLARVALKSLLQSMFEAVKIFDLSLPHEIGDVPSKTQSQMSIAIYCLGSRSPSANSVAADIKALREVLEDTPIVLLGDADDSLQLDAAAALGINAYVPSNSDPSVVRHIIELARRGGVFLPARSDRPDPLPPKEHASPVGHANGPTSRNQPPLSRRTSMRECSPPETSFTRREREVLECLGVGMQNKLIAHELSLQESTVKVHVRNILKKLKANSRTQAALYARDLGTIGPAFRAEPRD
ncbi:MAG: response regulator transcription factor [Pseudomonadota bacterium]